MINAPRDLRGLELLRIFYSLIAGIAIGGFLATTSKLELDQEARKRILKIASNITICGLAMMCFYGFLVFFGF